MMTDADGALAAQFAATFDSTDTQDWNDVLGRLRPTRARRPRWQLALAMALVAALLVATTALAFGHTLRNVFFGAPAPPLIKRALVDSNHYRELIHRWEIAHGKTNIPLGPTFDPSRVRGIMAIHTREGLLMMWSAPTVNGPRCWFIAFAGDQLHRTPRGSTDCVPPRLFNAIDWNTGWTIDHPTVKVLSGWVAKPRAAAIEVHYPDKPMQRYALVDGYFLAAFPVSWHSPWKVVAVDDHGNAVAVYVVPKRM